ncbi:hypothetical protein BJH93_05795 [Kocuria polaris]|nr:hypothetical protein [Kocuria polaris]
MGSESVWVWPVVGLGVLLVALAGTALAFAWGRRNGGSRQSSALPLAHTEHLSELPAYRSLRRRHRLGAMVGVLALGVALVAVAALSARPAQHETLEERLATRDIVLCMDISGSMVPYAAEVIDVYAKLTDEFAGERIALVIFNSTSRVLIPLTDDYRMVQAELERVGGLLDDVVRLVEQDPEDRDEDEINRVLTLFAGTESADGGSLVGDGLASCALQFDEQYSERSRSVLLTTDNEVFMEGVYDLDQAADLASSRAVELYGLYAGSADGGPEAEAYRETVQAHDGLYFAVTDPKAVEQLVADVQAQQAVDLAADAESIVTDAPRDWFVWALLGVGLVILVGGRGRA